MVDSASNTNEPSEALSDEQAVRLLASETRRAALRALQREPCVSLDALASRLAEDDNRSLERPDRLRQRLHHCHLPALDTAGVLCYDADDLSVDYHGDETIEQFLVALDD